MSCNIQNIQTRERLSSKCRLPKLMSKWHFIRYSNFTTGSGNYSYAAGSGTVVSGTHSHTGNWGNATSASGSYTLFRNG